MGVFTLRQEMMSIKSLTNYSKCNSMTNRLPVKQYSFELSAFKYKVIHIREKKVTSLGINKSIHIDPMLASSSYASGFKVFNHQPPW